MSIQTLLQEYKEAKAAFQEKLKEALKVNVKELFVKVPELTAIAFTAYSPYFNDGDPCEFSVNAPIFTSIPLLNEDGEPRFEPNDLVNEDVEDEDGWIKSFWSAAKSTDSEVDQTLSAFSGLLQDSAMEEVIESMFGDGVLVFITKDSITTEEYDHD